jgi:3-deoxy-D-manno-octulosonate 8-phosphate phosphatase (KDO 8-P phosphatase)
MNYLKKFRNIQNFIFDIDGVLTQGDVFLTPEGHLLRRMAIRDGYAIRIAIDKGYRVCIISGGITPGAEKRLGALGVVDIYLDEKNKRAAYRSLLKKYNMDPETIIYMGDDLPDYEVMCEVGLPCCPKDAVDEIRDISAYVSPKKGGEGCVRDVIEKVLKLKGNWPGYPNLPVPGE